MPAKNERTIRSRKLAKEQSLAELEQAIGDRAHSRPIATKPASMTSRRATTHGAKRTLHRTIAWPPSLTTGKPGSIANRSTATSIKSYSTTLNRAR